MKTKKRKKSTRMHGHHMGTHGGGARKKRKGSGHRGGKGMSGSGKRADHKKTLVLKLYGHHYFGKQGVTSRKTQRDTRQRINLGQIELHLEKYGKKSGDKWQINLEKYKILGDGEVKNKLVIKCAEASKTAIEKVKKSGGEILLTGSPKRGQTKGGEIILVKGKESRSGSPKLRNAGRKVKDEKEVEEE